MQIKNASVAVSLFLAFCVASLLAGCQLPLQKPWRLTATKNGDTVQLCLSHELTCPQSGGVSPAGISMYRYDNTYDNQLVWDAEPDNPITNGKISGLITYGIPPKNWSNKMVPPALICGRAYLVNPATTLFALQCDGSVVVLDFPHLEEFFRQQGPPPPPKNPPTVEDPPPN